MFLNNLPKKKPEIEPVPQTEPVEPAQPEIEPVPEKEEPEPMIPETEPLPDREIGPKID